MVWHPESSDEEDDAAPVVAKPNVNDVLIAAAKKPKVVAAKHHAGLYKRSLIHIPESEPWYGMAYFGQVNRGQCKSVEEAVHARWKEEDQQAVREDKDIGLLAAIDMYGPAALENEILHGDQGDDREALQRWVDELEKKYIADNGGPFRDDGSKCTLNLTHGGQGNTNFASMDALRTVAWKRFARELEAYGEEWKTALVPVAYVSPSGYTLGSHVGSVRNGTLWRGHPDQAKRVEWLEKQPGWAWRAHDSPEWLVGLGQRTKDFWDGLSDDAKREIARKQSETKSTPEFFAAASQRKKDWWDGLSPTEYAEQIRKLSEAHRTPEYLSTASVRQSNWWASLDENQRKEQIRKMKSAASTPEAIEKQSRNSKDWWASLTNDEYIEQRRKLSDAHSTQDYIEAASQRGKDRWANASDEQRDAWRRASSTARWTEAAKEANAVRKHEEAVAKQAAAKKRMTDAEQAAYQLRIDANLEKSARDHRALAVLRTVPGWEDASVKSLKDARLAGVIPNGNVRPPAKGYAGQKAALAELKKIPGWETSTHHDISKARKLGVLPDGRKRKRS